ncbi:MULTISPECIES: TnpV protein [Eisenbergiella]|uniref:TnpV protein n=1 Tax=Eisenbergiella porci TaxID=2652274 RepID=A0A6N7W5X4_9FIRM|nr:MULTISPECIES: TnpV protein [Eisenbergiella]MDY2654957.1 TnpV protein [Eisenbergiella porci]MSS90656.1 TnpV protein [Eisenbergiella porci]
MEKYIYDENNGLWYELVEDYYIPCLALLPEENKPIGIWGQRHLQYVKNCKRVLYTSLLTSCKLNSYLANIDEQAENMFFRLVKKFAEKENATEKLKAKNAMLWIGKMNNIQNAAAEIVNQELIFI